MNETKNIGGSAGEPCGMWIRVSSNGQDEQSQVPDNMGWIRGHDYRLVPGAVYTVHGRSAYKVNKGFDREWAKVLADFESGLIRVLVVWKLSRLDRKLAAMKMIGEVVALGGRIEFVTQQHVNDLSGMAGRLALHVEEELAHGDSENKSGAVKISQASKIAKGSVVGPAGWGLEIGPGVNDAGETIKTLVPTADGLKWAPVIFEMVAANESLATVARHLTGHSVKTKTGKTEWSPQTVGQIIRCKSMCGRRQDASGNTVLTFEPLVPIDLWNQANAALDTRKSRGPMLIEHKSMLSGVLRCPKCSGPMYLVDPKYSTKGPSYRCAGRGVIRTSKCRNMISQPAADAWVNAKMLGDHSMIMKLGPAEGGELRLALDDVMNALRHLPDQGYDWEKEDAERANLRLEQTRLTDEIEAAKFAPPKMVSTEVTHSQMWASLDDDDGAKNKWLRDSGALVTGMAGDDGAVQMVCDLRLAALFYDQDEEMQIEQIEEIPPVVDGVWMFIAPGWQRKMRKHLPRS